VVSLGPVKAGCGLAGEVSVMPVRSAVTAIVVALMTYDDAIEAIGKMK
jgi:hypothetical protein